MIPPTHAATSPTGTVFRMDTPSEYNQKILALWDNDIVPKLKEAVHKSKDASKIASRIMGNGQATPAAMIDALAEAGEISELAKTELRRIRDVRNILAHGGSGQINVTRKMYDLAKKYTISFNQIPALREVAVLAKTADRSKTLHDALVLMRENDFDVLPYNENGTWRLFTRIHVSRWLEAEFMTAPMRTSFSTEIALDDVLKIVAATHPTPPPNQGVLIPDGEMAISAVLDRIHGRDRTTCLPVVLFEDRQQGLHIATEHDLLQRLVPVQ